jgi:hypothetical protein
MRTVLSPGALDVTKINQAVERKVMAGPFVEPARRHDPRIIAAKVALLRFGNGCLVPAMIGREIFPIAVREIEM